MSRLVTSVSKSDTSLVLVIASVWSESGLVTLFKRRREIKEGARIKISGHQSVGGQNRAVDGPAGGVAINRAKSPESWPTAPPEAGLDAGGYLSLQTQKADGIIL